MTLDAWVRETLLLYLSTPHTPQLSQMRPASRPAATTLTCVRNQYGQTPAASKTQS